MAQLNLFNGGLSTRLLPHLININEAVVLTNVDVSKGSLTPLKVDKDEGETVGKSMVYFKNKWVYSEDNLDYVVFQEKLYASNVGIPQKSNDGVTWYNLGIQKPISKPAVAINGAGNLTGTYQYCYTYYNSFDGTESQPSEYSAELVPSDNKIDITVVASSDPQVDRIRIYRLGGSFTVMVLAKEITNTNQTTEDNLDDLNVPGDILTSYLYGQAPSGLKYLTKANAMFFGALNDKLYFSEVAYINAWSPYSFIDFDEPITGIGACANGLLVFTEYSTYIVTGNSPTSLSKFLVSDNQGCLLHKSIKFISNTLLWLSHDGICTSNGTEVQVLTRPKLGKISFILPKDSVVYDDVYYLAHQDGIFVVDFRYGILLYNISGNADCFHVKNNILYYGKDNALYSLFTGDTYRNIKYLGPNLSDGSIATRKIYKLIKVYSSSDIVFNIYIDNKRAISKNLESGLNEIQLPTTLTEGYYITFEVAGTGTIYEIIYNIQGTQSGN